MGIEPFLLASASIASLSQRLVRRLCAACRHPAPPTPRETARLAELGADVAKERFFLADGCPRCEKKGFTDRLPLVELLPVTDALRELIHEKVPTMTIQRKALDDGMVPLLSDGLRLARAGETSLSEVLRVAG
jgi:general secretion pathway protein E